MTLQLPFLKLLSCATLFSAERVDSELAGWAGPPISELCAGAKPGKACQFYGSNANLFHDPTFSFQTPARAYPFHPLSHLSRTHPSVTTHGFLCKMNQGSTITTTNIDLDRMLVLGLQDDAVAIVAMDM